MHHCSDTNMGIKLGKEISKGAPASVANRPLYAEICSDEGRQESFASYMFMSNANGTALSNSCTPIPPLNICEDGSEAC